MPILQCPGEIMPGQLGPINRDSPVLQKLPGAHHVERRNALGDADDQFQFGVGRFHDGIRRVRRRHKDHRRIRRSLVHGFLHGVEDRPAFVRGAALAGRDSADNLGPILRASLGVKCAFPPGQALHDHPRRFINQNAHGFLCSFALRSAGVPPAVGGHLALPRIGARL